MTTGAKTAALRLQLIDDATRNAGRIGAALQRLDKQIGDFARRRDRAMADFTRAATQAAALVGAVAWPTMTAGAFETSLENIRQKIDGTTESMRKLSAEIRKSGLQSGVGAQRAAATYDALLGLGATERDASGMAPSINRASQAYRADTGQLSQAVYSSSTAFGIAAGDTGKALDIMAESGKRGAVELADMSRVLPSLSAQFSALGQSGLSALADLSAQLQVVRKSTGTADEAAVSLQNFYSSLTGPTAQKRLKDAGINLGKLQTESAKTGTSLVDLILDAVQKKTGGNAEKIAEIFPDRESQRAIRPLMANRQELADIRGGSLAADGVVDRDFESRMQTFEGKLDRLRAGIEEVTTSLGEKLLPSAKQVMDAMIRAVDRLDAFIDRNGELIVTVTKAAAALVGFRLATAGVRLAFWSMAVPLAQGVSTLGKLGLAAHTAAGSMIALQAALKGSALTGFQKVSAGLRGMVLAVPGLGAVSSALAGIGTALAAVSAPAWLAIAAGVAAVAGAGALLWKYWDRLSSVAAGVGRAIGEQLAPAIEAARPVLNALAPVGEAIGTAWEKARSALSAVGDWFSSFFTREVLSEGDQAKLEASAYDVTNKIVNAMKAGTVALFEVGSAMIQSLWDGAVAKFGELLAWFQGIPARIKAAIGNIDLSGVISWPSMPSWLGGGGDKPAEAQTVKVDGARADGGPVTGGRPYLVGERGPEIVVPRRSGTVVPNHALGGGGVTVKIDQTLQINGHGAADLQKLAEDAARRVSAAVNSALSAQLNRSSQTAFGGVKPYGD